MLTVGVLAVLVVVSCSLVSEYRCARTLKRRNRDTASTLAEVFASALRNDQHGLKVVL